MLKKSKEILNKPGSGFLILLLFVLLDRYFILNYFGFTYTGSDEMIFWQGLNDYSKGIFHEPYFYGQNYTFMLESLFAVPLFLCGLPFEYALPTVTSLMALFPFLLFSFLLYRKSFITGAFIFLSLPLFLPVGYEVLTTISRGFVTGIFAGGFLVFSLLKPGNRSSWLILGLAVSLAYVLNPNSLVFTFPVAVFVFLLNYRKPGFYLISIVPALIILTGGYLARHFYITHPEYVVNSMWPLDFSFDRLLDAFRHLDKYFAYMGPLAWPWGWLSLPVILACGVFLIRKDLKKGVSTILGLLFVLFALGVNKVNDDLGTVFFSSSRMFLGLPLFLALCFFWVSQHLAISHSRFIRLFLPLSLLFFVVKVVVYKPVIQKYTSKENHEAIAVKRVDVLKSECAGLDRLTRENNTGLVIFLPNWRYNVPSLEFYNYACPLLHKDFPPTVMNVYEKRTWVFQRERYAVYPNILLFGEVDLVTFKGIKDWELISGDPVMTVIRGNDLPVELLLKKIGVCYKRNTY